MNVEGKSYPHSFSYLALAGILLLAAGGDRVYWYSRFQASRGDFSTNFFARNIFWVHSLTILLVGVLTILVTWYLLSRAPRDRFAAWLYIAAGLLLVFSPEIYLSQAIWKAIGFDNPVNGLFAYLAQYHGPQSVLYHSGGAIAAIGFIWLVIRHQKNPVMSQPADSYIQLRSKILGGDPSDKGIRPDEVLTNVWGVLMEFQVTGSVVTLVSLADGTSSLYFSNGGGIIGAGQNEDVANASKSFIAKAESLYSHMKQTTLFPLPEKGRIGFFILTFDGIYAADVPEDELTSQRHEFSVLFLAGNEVISQIRLHPPEIK